jgi:hypothetical protein
MVDTTEESVEKVLKGTGRNTMTGMEVREREIINIATTTEFRKSKIGYTVILICIGKTTVTHNDSNEKQVKRKQFSLGARMLDIHSRRMKLDPFFIPYVKINSNHYSKYKN